MVSYNMWNNFLKNIELEILKVILQFGYSLCQLGNFKDLNADFWKNKHLHACQITKFHLLLSISIWLKKEKLQILSKFRSSTIYI